MQSGTLILPEWLISNTQSTPNFQWGVRVVGDRVTEVAPNQDLLISYPNDRVWHAPNQVLAPGFVNSHLHIYGVLAHGIPLKKAPAGFWPFLEDFWWPLIENRIDHPMLQSATNLRCFQMIRTGVTTFYDITEAPNALPGCLDVQADVVRKWGLRGILSFEACERVSAQNGQLGLQENLQFIDACRHRNDLVSGLMSIHTTFTCSESFIRTAYSMAQDRNVLFHAHVSEGTYEPEYCQRKFGMRAIPYYQQIGVASPSFLASQCVQLDDVEIRGIASSGIRVSHMPLSNCEVGGGIAPIPQLLAAGATVGLGSDGYIDDFFEVMRGAFLIHKANQLNPLVMPAQQVWYMATEGGAKALNLENIGRLEPGWQADLQLINASFPTPLEEHNLYDQLLLYRGIRDVAAVMIAGQVRMEKGEVLGADYAKLVANTHEAAESLWKQAR
jgi:cytosine/adenosine deaminase-related metal-dependent hydrolase